MTPSAGVEHDGEDFDTDQPPATAETNRTNEVGLKVGDETWRSKRIARGVPKDDVPKPRMQEIANSDLDTARLLNVRGNIAEVPDLPEENQLKKMLTKKAEWLYSAPDSLVLNAKRNTIQQMAIEHSKTQSWTLAGRLVCDIHDRPPVRNAPIPQQPLPHILRQRAPMTRTEVTEQRLIGNAAIPPAPPPHFSIEAKAPGSSTVRSPWPLSARGSPGERNTASAASAVSSAGRVLVETPRAAPLTAR